MTEHDEDEALEREIDRAAMVATKLALEAVAAFLKGHARICIDHSGDAETWITFEPTAKGLNES